LSDKVRLGIIGAGNYTCSRMLPNFLKLPQVDVVAVANRSLLSAKKVASAFGIPQPLDDWRSIVQRDDIDAVLIGTPPYAHPEIVCEAMLAGKDVLCQTRMATTLQEAYQMLQTAKESGRKSALVRPSRYITAGRYLKHLIDTGYVGNVRQVFCYRLIPDYTDSSLPLGRRQNAELYGKLNCLYLGYCWDILRDWFGEPSRVFAHSLQFTPQRHSESKSEMVPVLMPEAISAIAEMQSGASIMSIQSGLTFFGEDRIEIYGDEGTLIYTADDDSLLGGRKANEGLAPIEVPPEFKESWAVEQDFIHLVQGEIASMFPTFSDGVKNMEYLDACHRSALEGRWVAFN
jgi:predicted dehydrogenase